MVAMLVTIIFAFMDQIFAWVVLRVVVNVRKRRWLEGNLSRHPAKISLDPAAKKRQTDQQAGHHQLPPEVRHSQEPKKTKVARAQLRPGKRRGERQQRQRDAAA